MNMDIDYGELLLQSTVAAVEPKFSSLAYDQTIVCTIVNASDSENGHYQVTNGTVTFDAYSEKTNYLENTQVYVVIPKSDWTAQKQITGQYIMTGGPVTFVSALDRMCIFQAAAIPSPQPNKTYGTLQTVVKTTKLSNSVCVRFKVASNGIESPEPFSITTIAVDSIGVEHILPSYSSKQMFGNPFYYLTPVEYEISYPIEQIIDFIDKVKITINLPASYQAYGIKVSITDVKVYFGFDTSNYKDDSVFIYPIDRSPIYFGAKEQMPEDISVEPPPDIKVPVKLIWINKDDEGRFIGFTDILKPNQEEINIGKATGDVELELLITKDEKGQELEEPLPGPDADKVYYWIDWYRDLSYGDRLIDNSLRENLDLDFVTGAGVPDNSKYPPAKYSKTYYIDTSTSKVYKSNLDAWVEDPKILAGSVKPTKDSPKAEEYKNYRYIYYSDTESAVYVSDGTDWIRNSKQPQGLTQDYALTLLREYPETEIQAEVWRNGKSYKSNLLVFKNEAPWINELAGLGVQLFLEHTQNGKDIYLYQEGILSKDVEGDKTLRFNWTAYNRLDDGFWLNSTVTWMLPKTNTMLLPSETLTIFRHLNKLQKEEQELSVKEQSLLATHGENYEIYCVVLDKNAYEDGLDEEAKTGTLKDIYRQFSYRIMNTYNENLFNNIIRCTIELPENTGTAEARKNIIFESFGIQGTDYTFAIAPSGRNYGFSEFDKSFIFEAHLLDPKGRIQDTQIEWSVVDTNTMTIDKNAQNLQDNQVSVIFTGLSKDNILKAKTQVTWGGKQIWLTKEYPVSYSQEGVYYSDAPSVIYYDSLGQLITYQLSELQLYKYEDNTIVNGISWVQSASSDTSITRIENNSIKPSPFFVGDESIALDAQQNMTTIWYRPLLIRQNRYSNELLNDWNGELLIDPKSNTILARAIGAGIKHTDNSFSGVFMGDIKSYETNPDGTRGKETGTETGLLGYSHGAQAFGFRDNGTAFIGESGAGRINFEGNRGLIVSQTIQDKIEKREDKWEWKTDENGKQITPISWIKKEMETETEEEPVKGTLIDLKSGEILLDSGDNHFIFSEADGLDIRANRVKITSGVTTGINLLEETEPSGNFIYPIPTDEEAKKQQEKPLAQFAKVWTYIGDEQNEAYKIESRYNTFGYFGNSIYLTQSGISQKVKLEPNKKYTLSGYVKEKFTTIIVDASSSSLLDFTIEVKNGGYFKQTFSSPVNEEQKCEIQFIANGSDSVELYHLKLEEGEEATKWTATSNDVNSRFEITDSKIESAVMGMKDYINGQTQALGTQITQTADSISSFAYAAGAYNFTDKDGNRIKIAVVGEGDPDQLIYNPNDYQNEHYLDVTSGKVYKSQEPYNAWTSTGIILDTTYSQIKQEADAITMTVAGADTTWDIPNDITITIQDYGNPNYLLDRYPLTEEKYHNKYYLNLQPNKNGYGDIWYSKQNDDEEWVWEITTYKATKKTEKLSSEIQQTKDAIRLNVNGVSCEWTIPDDLDIAIISKGDPQYQTYLFPVTEYQGQYYLDETNGYVYLNLNKQIIEQGEGEPQSSAPTSPNRYYLDINSGKLWQTKKRENDTWTWQETKITLDKDESGNYNIADLPGEWKHVQTLQKASEVLGTQIEQTKKSITSAAYGVEGDFDYVGEGAPTVDKPKSPKNGETYLDYVSGQPYEYEESSGEWKTDGEPLLTNYSQIKQTKDAITSTVKGQEKDWIIPDKYKAVLKTSLKSKGEPCSYLFPPSYYKEYYYIDLTNGYVYQSKIAEGTEGYDWWRDTEIELIPAKTTAELGTEIEQTKDSITSAAYGVDTSKLGYNIDIFHNSAPEKEMYPPADYVNHYYLNYNTGDVYYSDGQEWALVTTTETTYSQIKQTMDEIDSKVSDSQTGQSFGWNLNSTSFSLYANGDGTTNDENNKVFYCDRDGITINGSGTFNGSIISDSALIGDPDGSYLKFNKSTGKLEIQADTISFISGSPLGITNLIDCSYPNFVSDDLSYDKTVDPEVKVFTDYWWHTYDNSPDDGNMSEELDEGWQGVAVLPASIMGIKEGNCIVVANELQTSSHINQALDILPDTKYTISGIVAGRGALRIRIRGSDGTIKKDYQPTASRIYGSNTKWTETVGKTIPSTNKFSYTFNIGKIDPTDKVTLMLYNSSNQGRAAWYRIKLEEGTIATAWTNSAFDVQSRIDVSNESIRADVVSKTGGSKSGFGWDLNDTSFSLYKINGDINNRVFYCHKGGIEVTGTINATGGKIGSWELSGDWLQTNVNNQTVHTHHNGVAIHRPTSFSGKHDSSDIVMLCRKGTGNASTEQNTFILFSDGYLHAVDANITGTINATDGKIGDGPCYIEIDSSNGDSKLLSYNLSYGSDFLEISNGYLRLGTTNLNEQIKIWSTYSAHSGGAIEQGIHIDCPQETYVQAYNTQGVSTKYKLQWVQVQPNIWCLGRKLS